MLCWSLSTTQASISFPMQTSILTNVYTNTSHTQPHTSGHLHHTNTPTSSNNSKKSRNLHQTTIPKRRPTTTNMFPSTDIRLKRPKKSPFSYQHHKTLLPLDHNTNPKSSSATTTIKPLLIDSETTPIQSTSTNTVCTITVDTTTPTTTQTISTIHPTLPSMPPLPPTPVHKPTSQFPPSCRSTSPSHPGSTHPPPP